MKMLARSIAIFLFLAPVATLRAQTVTGQVLDDHATPVPKTRVFLLDSALATVDSGTADATGTFRLTAPHAGRYAVRAFNIRFLPVDTRAFTLSAGDSHQEQITLSTAPSSRVYYEFEVQQHVTPMPGNQAPKYPASLRDQRVNGEVLLQFVVDTSGRAAPGTTSVLRSNHSEFTQAAIAVVPSHRFNPARLNGQVVPQVVQVPFYFNITP
jgi:TonB family protein